MRCFIAVELDETIKDRIEAAQKLFKNLGGKVGWCNRGQMHLTLKFLGEVSDDLIPKAVEALKAAVAETAPFEMTVEGLGAFPPSGQPRVLWVGVRKCPPLFELQERIEKQFNPLGFPREDRGFSPHLTLGRVRERIDTKTCLAVLTQQKNFFAGTQQVGKVILLSSTLSSTGAVYTSIEEVILNNK
jgi:RNA 2',3'-cyclic 3'-phosphodiesterase